MSVHSVKLTCDQASAANILSHLRACDDTFMPRLSSRVDLDAYADKLHRQATRFEAWSDGTLVGLLAGYLDTGASASGYISNVSVLPDWRSRGLAPKLLGQFIDRAKERGLRSISLEVGTDNTAARRLYERAGFTTQAAVAEANAGVGAQGRSRSKELLTLMLPLIYQENTP